MNGTLAAIRDTKMTLVGFGAAVCGSATTPGDTGTGGVGISDLVSFLDAAAVQNPTLKVFATLSSHHPLSEYCHMFLNDLRTDINWTRVGTVIANATRGRKNFVGVYIDDFYVMMCTPESRTFSRHGSSTALPCVPMSAMDDMRNAMQAITPSLAFLPLVYHLQTAFAVPDSVVIGAPSHVKFVPPARASASIEAAVPILAARPRAVVLRFFYHCWLSAWAKPGTKPVNGTVTFQAKVNGHTFLTVDASTVHDVSLFEIDISPWLRADTAVVSFSFETFPTLAAADPEHSWIAKDCYKTTYVYGVSVDGHSPQHSGWTFSTSGGDELLARRPTEASLIGHAEGMIVQRQQDPSFMLPTEGYVELMQLVQRSNQGSSVFGGHYSRLGMPWTTPTSSTALSQGLAADRRVKGLAGSMVFEMPLMVGRCRSKYDACDRGIFSGPRQLTTAKDNGTVLPASYNGMLFWPNEAVALSGWFQRYTTALTIPAKTRLTICFSDSQAVERKPTASRDEFRKRVVGLFTGVVYYEAPIGVFTNGSSTCPEQGVACPGQSATAIRCEIVCSGPGGGQSNITLTTMHSEKLVVELRTGSQGSTHAVEVLRVILPNVAGWKFSSGLDDQQDGGVRALYNATVQAFARH